MQFQERFPLSLFTLGISEIINKLIPLFILRLARIKLGVEVFGQAQYAIIFIESIAPFVSLGSSLLGALEVSKLSTDRKNFSNDFSFHLIIAKLTNMLLISIALIIFVASSDLYQYRWYILSASLLLFSTVLETDFVNLGKQTMMLRHIFTVIAKILGLFLIVYFVESKNDIYAFIVFYCLPMFLLSLFSFISNLKYINFSLPSLSKLIDLYKKCFPFTILFFLLPFFDRFDVFMVEFFYSSRDLGTYTSHFRLVQAVTNSIAALGLIFFSEQLAARLSQRKKAIFSLDFSSLFIIYPPILIITFFLSDEIFSLFFSSHHDNKSFLQPLILMSSFFSQIIGLFAIRVLVIEKQIKKVNLTVFLSLGLGFLWSLAFKEVYSLGGIVLGQILAKLTACVILAKLSLHYLDRINFNPLVFKSFKACVVMTFFLLLPLESFWLRLSSAVLIYISVSLFLCFDEIKRGIFLLIEMKQKKVKEVN